MRRTVKGAAAIAALSATALAFSSAAFALPALPGSGTGLDQNRLAGIDRVQTAQEVFETHSVNPVATTVNVFVVNKTATVDALALAPLAKSYGPTGSQSYVLYADKDGLDATSLKMAKDLKGKQLGDIILIGGEGSLSDKAYMQIIDSVYSTEAYNVSSILDASGKNTIATVKVPNFNDKKVKVYRIGGKDRYETAYLVGAVVMDHSLLQDISDIHMMEWWKANAAKHIADFEAAEKAYFAAIDKDQAAKAALKKASDALVSFYKAHPLLTGTQIDAIGATAMQEYTAKIEKAKEDYDDVVALEKAFAEKVKPFVDAHVEAIKKEDKDAKDHDYVLLGAVESYLTKLVADPNNKDAAAHKGLLEIVKKSRQLVEFKNYWSKPGADGKTQPESVEVLMAKGFKAEIDARRVAYDKALQSLDAFVEALRKYQGALADKELYKPGGEVTKLLDARDAAQAAADSAAKALDEAAKAKFRAQVLLNANPFVVTPYFAERKLSKMNEDFWKKVKGLYANGRNPIVVARGDIFPDALTAGPAAASLSGKDGFGILLLSDHASLTEQVKSAIATPRSLYAVGGDAVTALAGKGVAIKGVDRYATSAEVAKYFFKDANKQAYALTSGEIDADAVVAGCLVVSKDMQGILLTKRTELPKSVGQFIQYGTGSGKAAWVKSVQVVGGPGSVSVEVLKSVALSDTDSFIAH